MGFHGSTLEVQIKKNKKNNEIILNTHFGASVSVKWPLDMDEEQSEELYAVVENVNAIMEGLIDGVDDDPDAPFYAVNL
jgi:hypothetical protein